MDTTAARNSILESIRRNLAASESLDRNRVTHDCRTPIRYSGKPVEYASLAEQFKAQLETVNGRALIVHGADEAARAVDVILKEAGAIRVAVSDSPLLASIVPSLATRPVVIDSTSRKELFDCDAGITSAQHAVAETGTLVLESESEHHRLASLVPPIHIAVIESSRIVPTLSDALERLKEKGEISRTVTFITGPSRTADIELILTIGVHGPQQLHVIIVE